MAITISVDVDDVNGEGTSLVSSSITPVSGDTQLFICVSVDDTTEGDITSVTDSDGGTITQIADFTNGNRRIRFYAIASPSLVARTITVNFGSATDATLDVFTVKGSSTDADPSDVEVTSTDDSASPSTSITPNVTTGGMIIWMVHQSDNSTYSSFGTGQTERGMVSQGGAERYGMVLTTEIYTAAPGAQSATATKSAPWCAMALEIKEADISKTLTHTTDSYLIHKRLLTHITDSLLKKLDNLLTHTTDSLLKALDNLKTHTTDSLLKKHDTRTHATDSVLLKHDTRTHTTDSLLKKLDNLLTHTTDSLLKALGVGGSCLMSSFSESFESPTTQTEADKVWVSNDVTATRVNIVTNKLDFDIDFDTSNDFIVHKLPSAISNSTWVFRSKLRFSTLTNGTNFLLWYGLSNLDQT